MATRPSRRPSRELRESGVSPTEVQALLDRLLIMPVFTAHPTEAKRRTVLTKLARIADVLRELDLASPTPEEERAAHEALREELVSLWQTEETRAYQPDVMDEVRNGLYYFETTLFDLAPELGRLARARGGRRTTRAPASRPAFLRFGSWIGGDRDGNPFVTVAVTEETLREHHELALRLLRRGIDRLHGHLSTTERLGVCDGAPRAAWRPTRRASRTRRRAPSERYRRQPYRQKMALRLPQARGDARGEPPPLARRPRRPPGHVRRCGRASSPTCGSLQESLRAHRGERLADGRLGTLCAAGRDLRLPPRQPRPAAARRAPRERALAEVLARYGLAGDYATRLPKTTSASRC